MWCRGAETPAGLAFSARHHADSVRGRSKPGGEQRCAAPVVKLLRERQVLSRRLCLCRAQFLASTSAHSQTAAARRSCTFVGPTAAAFCRRKAGWEGVHHATNILESAGSAVMALIGDFSDSSGTYTTPQAALWARRQAQAKRRRDAKTQCQLGVLFVPVGFRETRR